MVNDDAKTIMKRLMSSKTDSALFSGASMKIADKYWANAITGML